MRAGLFTAAAAAAVALTGVPAAAQSAPHDGHAGGMAGMAAPADATPATKAYMEAMQDMHGKMTIEYSGDADIDFVRGMIPHHQGAVDMARIEMEHGKDPEMRALAEKIVATQQVEIEAMNAWLKAHDPAAR